MACSNFTYAPLPHFNNPTLIDVIEKLRQTCPDDLVDGIGIRSDIAKEIFQGVNSLFSTSLGRWSPYAGAIIVSRLIDFKLPLVQLISQLPRPRLVLGRWGEAFAILHMIVDPIDSMSSYLFTLATCQVVLRRTKEIMASIHGISPSKLAYEIKRFGRRCNHIALVYVSYASNGQPKRLENLISYEAAHPEAFETAALSLAADRGSNFLAVGVAIFGFLMAVIVKYVYIDAETFDMTNPQHIDIWSLSSSMTMMHIIPNVLLASIISTQQSRNTASRFLQGFEERIGLRERGADWAQLEAGQQIDHGAIPNWRPNRHHASMPCGLQAIRSPWRWIIDLASFLIVMTGSAGAIGLAAAVPPRRFNCRTVIKLIMMSVYLVKYAAQLLVNQLRTLSTRQKMWITTAMDIISVSLFASIIFTTQSGILNCPGCYEQCQDNGECGVYPALITWNIVRERLRVMYPGILFGFLGMQILICAALLVVVWEARKVYLQDDEAFGEDNRNRGNRDL